MNNPRFVKNEDIPLIEDEDYDNYLQYYTPDMSRIEETLFTQDTEQPAVRLSQRLLCDHKVEL